MYLLISRRISSKVEKIGHLEFNVLYVPMSYTYKHSTRLFQNGCLCVLQFLGYRILNFDLGRVCVYLFTIHVCWREKHIYFCDKKCPIDFFRDCNSPRKLARSRSRNNLFSLTGHYFWSAVCTNVCCVALRWREIEIGQRIKAVWWTMSYFHPLTSVCWMRPGKIGERGVDRGMEISCPEPPSHFPVR